MKIPSFPMALFRSFGTPYMMVGGLKLFHDSCMFVGPLMLNRLIVFLSDPTIPLSTGLYYVLGIFLSNFAMSICLRQYFWWCYRVGMRLRSAAITAVFNKSLVSPPPLLSSSTLKTYTTAPSLYYFSYPPPLQPLPYHSCHTPIPLHYLSNRYSLRLP